MTCNIIDFKSATTRHSVTGLSRLPVAAKMILGSARTERAEPSTETLSPTLKNSRLRKKRKAAWLTAEAVKDYWMARLNLNSAVERVQRRDAPEGRDHPAVTPDDHWPLVKSFRKALVEQLLTPAPNRADVSWKKATLAGGQHRYVDYAKAEQLGRLIERAIEDDEAFLAEHPTRSKRKAEAEA
jgi:hypothetical protein